MNNRTVPLVVVALCLGLACLAAGASALTAQRLTNAAASPTPDPLFFSVIPSNGSEPVRLQIAPDEQAMVSIASISTDVPQDIWTQAGWKLGAEIGPTEEVPMDCVLHARQGTPRQMYAQCSGGQTLVVPGYGGNFIYVVLSDSRHILKKMLRTGKLYNADTTGLIP